MNSYDGKRGFLKQNQNFPTKTDLSHPIRSYIFGDAITQAPTLCKQLK